MASSRQRERAGPDAVAAPAGGGEALLERLTAALGTALRGHEGRVQVAFSGGADSSVLLALAARVVGPARLRALHVDHGLQAAAGGWAQRCRERCDAMGVALRVLAVDARPPAGESPEAWARACRYAALAACLERDEVLLTAHHRDDAEETLLLALLRGAGPRGLSGIPAARPLGAGRLLRPLLAFDREALRAAAAALGLDWVEDPSNADVAVPRNRLRAEVLPLLRRHWPGSSAALGRTMRLQADAAENLQALARVDLGEAFGQGTLPVRLLRGLPAARQRNALHWWLIRRGAGPPGWGRIEQLRALLDAAPDAHGGIPCSGLVVHRYRDQLYASPPRPPPAGELTWHPPASLRLPAGLLRATPAVGRGLAARHAAAGLRVVFRAGGERVRLAGRAHSSSLKKLFQQAGIPPWERPHRPLVLAGGALAAVPGIGVFEPFGAAAGEPGLVIFFERGGSGAP